MARDAARRVQTQVPLLGGISAGEAGWRAIVGEPVPVTVKVI
jgi:hypothetical protein